MMDSDGYFWFVGRADDVIISSGFVHSLFLESDDAAGREVSCVGIAMLKGLLSSTGTGLGHLKWRVR